MDKVNNKGQVVGLIEFLPRGGAELLMIRLLKNHVVSKIFLLENKIEFDLNQDMSESVYPLIAYKARNPFLKYLLIPYYAFRLSKIINKNTTVISLTHKSDIINILSKFFVKHKSIVTVVVAPTESYRGLRVLVLIFLKFLYRRFADMVVVDSYGIEHFCKDILRIPQEKLKTIHNPLAVTEVKYKAQEVLTKEESNLFSLGPVFITVGRLAWQKGQWHLLRIFKKIKRDIPDAKLIIIGDGDLRGYLTTLSEELGLKTFVGWRNNNLVGSYDVYFLGSKENPYKFISHSSVFIFTSFFEGGAYAVSEALVCGIPVVSADCRFGPREIIAPDTNFQYETKVPEFAPYGILMPVLDKIQRSASESLSLGESVWAETIVKLWKDNILLKKYVHVGDERVKAFDLDNIIPQWENVTQKVSSI